MAFYQAALLAVFLLIALVLAVLLILAARVLAAVLVVLIVLTIVLHQGHLLSTLNEHSPIVAPDAENMRG